jgi:hypothetical protein
MLASFGEHKNHAQRFVVPKMLQEASPFILCSLPSREEVWEMWCVWQGADKLEQVLSNYYSFTHKHIDNG